MAINQGNTYSKIGFALECRHIQYGGGIEACFERTCHQPESIQGCSTAHENMHYSGCSPAEFHNILVKVFTGQS